MKYKEILANVTKIKSKRDHFIHSFDTNYDFVYSSLTNAIDNNYLNSIRVHKYLTDNKKLGKVNTARYLEKICLDETTKISELNDDLIIKIATYCSES